MSAALDRIARARDAARDYFAAQSYPTTRDEDWRHTDVSPIVRAKLAAPAGIEAAAAQVEELRLGAPGALELVFVDGLFAPSLSRLADTPGGVLATSLAAALAAPAPDAPLDRLLEVADGRAHGFAAQNQASFRDGALLRIEAGRVLAAPIHLLHVSTGAAAHPRALLVLGDHAEAVVAETWVSLGEGAGFSNAVTEVVLGEGAILQHVKLQDLNPASFHIATLAAEIGRSAELRSVSLALGGRLARNEVHARLLAEGASTLLDGLYLIGGEQLSDNRTVVRHEAPHGTSVQLYKGIVGGRAHGVFNGRIMVEKGAQKTDSRQSNRNLLLSETALVDTKPELQIFADDVKCSHGATIGQIDDNALFYLRSRGIDAATARALVTQAFAAEVVSRIRHPELRARARARVVSRLPGGAGLEELS